MNKEQLEGRVSDLLAALERSAAQHNALAGRLAEAQEMLKFMDSVVNKAEDVVGAVESVVDAL